MKNTKKNNFNCNKKTKIKIKIIIIIKQKKIIKIQNYYKNNKINCKASNKNTQILKIWENHINNNINNLKIIKMIICFNQNKKKISILKNYQKNTNQKN